MLIQNTLILIILAAVDGFPFAYTTLQTFNTNRSIACNLNTNSSKALFASSKTIEIWQRPSAGSPFVLAQTVSVSNPADTFTYADFDSTSSKLVIGGLSFV